MVNISIGTEPIAVTSLYAAPQPQSDAGFAQTLQEAVEVGTAIPANTEQPIQSVAPMQPTQAAIPQEETQTVEALPATEMPQPEQLVQTMQQVQPEQEVQLQSQKVLSGIELLFEADPAQQEITEETPETGGMFGARFVIPVETEEEPVDSELMKELADLLGKTEERLTASQRMQETLKALITQAIAELNDPEVDEEEFTEMVLDFLMKFIDKTFGGERKETSIFADNDDKDDTDVQDVLLQAVVQMLDNIRSEDEETNVTEDTEDEEAVDASGNIPASKKQVNTTVNSLLEPVDELNELNDRTVEYKVEFGTENKVEASTYVEAPTPKDDTAAPQPHAHIDVPVTTAAPVAPVSNEYQFRATTEEAQVVEAVEQVDAPQPIETAKPIEAVRPVETVKPIETVQPIEAVQPIETAKPIEMVQSIETAKPIEAAQPTDTAKPIEATEPEEAPENTLYEAAAKTAESIYNAITAASEQVATTQPQQPIPEQPAQPVKAERSYQPIKATVIQPADELAELTRLVKGGDTVKSQQPQLDLSSESKAEAEPIKPAAELPELPKLGETANFETVIVTAGSELAPTRSLVSEGSSVQQVVTQIVSEIFNQLPEKGGTTTFVMTLNPETLGKVTVKLVEEAGKISVTVTAHSKHTAEILSGRFDNLQTAMKENGTQLEKYQVVYEPEQNERSGQQSFDGSSKNPYVKQDEEESEGDGEFAELLQQVV